MQNSFSLGHTACETAEWKLGQSAALLKFYQAGAAQGTTRSFATFSWWPHNSATISAATPQQAKPACKEIGGYALVQQQTHNSVMHALNGNTVLRLTHQGPNLQATIQLELDSLIPKDDTSPTPQYSRNFLLGRQLTTPPSSPKELSFNPPTLTHLSNLQNWSTPPLRAHAHTATQSRSGKRVRYKNTEGYFQVYRSTKGSHTTRNVSLNNSGIRNSNLVKSRTPPPRGVPGAILANEECSPTKRGANVGARGAKGRRARRRAYRQWRALHNKGLTLGADSPASHRTLSTKATQTRAKWFRQCLHWQATITRKKKPQVTEPKTTPPLTYNAKLRIGALNVQGMADTLKLKSIIQLMEQHKLGVVTLSETRSTSYYSYLSEQHLVILSGNTKDKYAGIGAVVHPLLRPHLVDVVQVNSRIIHLIFNKKGGKIHVIGCYAPHSGHDLDTVRQPFWDALEEYTSKIPQPEPIYMTGDFNVRFQAQHKNDKGVTGPYVYGKGAKHIDHTASSNRSLCVRSMLLQGMVEVASYKTPNPVHQITYRDKAAPPNDWSQFILDPLIMQQLYHSIQQRDAEQALEVAARIRSYLPLDAPLPPPQKQPHPDPTRFQCLDHTFTRKQWLSSVNSCRSKLHTGFPSDHYLLVTEVQVKLAQRCQYSAPRPKLDLTQPSDAQKHEFNEALRAVLGATPQTTPQNPHPVSITFYTDGSGTKGRCSKHTPAGWGWCSPQGDSWLEACGPVITSSDHTAFVGANVGSNNTAEVSAIIEALMFAIEMEYDRVTIHTDSAWARNVILGKWRPKTHKQLIHNAKRLLKTKDMTTTILWTKAHVGTEGNERADRLADQGKHQDEAQGGRTQALTAAPTRDAERQQKPIDITDAALHAAKATFKPHLRRSKKPWITDHTLTLLESAKKAEAQQDDNLRLLRNQAKRAARKDRIKWIHDQLQADPSATKSAWSTIKNQKRGFVGAKKHLIIDGVPQPWSKTHEAFRDHLQNKQWAAPHIEDTTHQRRDSRPHLHPTLIDEPWFQKQDLDDALQKLKKNKATGPDLVPNEIWLLLDDENLQNILDMYNYAWDSGTIPQSWAEAIVVSIYKGKGADTDPVNYRPISLLNTIYKIYAAMLQQRLSDQIEPRLRDTQFGFRPKKGTKHPLFILRRAMEWSLMTSTPLHILSLDWRQAFDSLDHTAMLSALKRFGLSARMIKAIQSIYKEPTFTTKGPQDHTAEGKIKAGIRQGCPLSPYLFVIVLTVIFSDIDQELLHKGTPTNTWSSLRPVYDLEYADDTLLLARTIPQLQSFLSTVEYIAQEYGMRLNTTKTELLLHDPEAQPNLQFVDGSKVPTTPQLKYLGSLISWKHPFSTAFYHRANQAEEAYKKLRLVWNSGMPIKTKLRIFRSTFGSVLMYGLDALSLTDKDLKRIDGFWFRFLRRIVGIKASFYSRVSNAEVYRKAGNPEKPSVTLQRFQFRTMVEVFKSPLTTPLHNVVFASAYKDRILNTGRRRGMQFPYWLEVITKRNYPQLWKPDHPAAKTPQHKYVIISKELRKSSFEMAPKRARTERAGPP